MNSERKKQRTILTRFAAHVALALVTLMCTIENASALGVQDECPRKPGYLVFIDRGGNNTPGRCGSVVDTNPDWRWFGWGWRADEYRNDGNTHNVCVYNRPNYDTGWWAQYEFMWRGMVLIKYDLAVSNKWTLGSGC